MISSNGINTCKLKELDAEFNADCKKRAAKVNIGAAAAKSRRGGDAKLYHRSPGTRPGECMVVSTCTRRPTGQGNGAGPPPRPTGRVPLEHRHQLHHPAS